MAQGDSLFIVEPSLGKSVRERELLQSQARSHASRISHKRCHDVNGKTKQSNQTTSHARLSAEAATEQTTTRTFSVVDHTQRRVQVNRALNDHAEMYADVDTSTSGSLWTEELESEVVVYGSPPIVKFAPLCSPAIELNESELKVLDYLVVGWLPSVNRFPLGCQLAMFTPFLPEDLVRAPAVVSKALQTTSQLHIYALLSCAATRMHFIHQVSPAEPHAKEIYFGKAVQALRFQLATELPITDQVIFDVGILALTELHNKSPVRSEVYWRLLIQMICVRGGLGSIDPFAAYCGVGVDYLMAAGTCTPPAFDLMANTALLGLKVGKVDQIERMVTIAVADFHPRLRILCQQTIILTQIIKAIHTLGTRKLTRTKEYVRKHSGLIARLLGRAAIPRFNSSINGRHNQQAASADGLLVRVRCLAFSVWLWHISQETSTGDVDPPFSLSTYVSEMCTCLDGTLSMFQCTGWVVRDDLVLWISALGTLVTKNSRQQMKFKSYFVCCSRKLNIRSISELWDVLAAYPPLERVDEDWVSRLWLVFNIAEVT